MPIGRGKAQMIFHRLAQNHLVGIVVAEGKFVIALRAFKLDGGNAFKKISHTKAP